MKRKHSVIRLYLLCIITIFSVVSWYLLTRMIFIASSGNGYIQINFNTYGEMGLEIVQFTIIFTIVLISGLYLILMDFKDIRKRGIYKNKIL